MQFQSITSGASGLRIGVVVSVYHCDITGSMLGAALSAFEQAGGNRDDVEVIEAPGAFELIAISAALARRGDLDAVVALGCIITGETTHDQHIATAVSSGIAHVIAETGVPIAFGVLTCQTMEQARARSGGAKGNKGEEAMLAAIGAARAIKQVRMQATAETPAGRK